MAQRANSIFELMFPVTTLPDNMVVANRKRDHIKCEFPFADSAAETKEIGGQTFRNISDEAYRVYVYACECEDGKRYEVRIDNPAWLRTGMTGTHRVVDKDGVGYFIPSGFLYIYWKSRPGKDAVKF